MARGFDELIEFLLAEIALCGAQGASSADFCRFISAFYRNPDRSDDALNVHPGSQLYAKVWTWLCSHPDVRVVHQKQRLDIEFREFQFLEQKESGTINVDSQISTRDSVTVKASQSPQITSAFFKQSLRDALRERLMTEEHGKGYGDKLLTASHRPDSDASAMTSLKDSMNSRSIDTNTSDPSSHSVKSTEKMQLCEGLRGDASAARPNDVHAASKQRGPRKIPKGVIIKEPIFDTPLDTVKLPRIYVSQNRTWKAVAGHSLDLKRLPYMSYELLSIIAAHGADGILQPELVKISGQDKRSVPGRTDRLAEAGYIEKSPVQASKTRTSLCVHKKFIGEGHFLKGAGNMEDAFRDRTVILSNFVNLLHKCLRDNDLVPMRQLRQKLGVDTQQWNQRAIRTAIKRLENSGFVRRVHVMKRNSLNETALIVKLLRAPTEDDIKNLSYRRKNLLQEYSTSILEEDEEADDLMRDLDLDLDDEEEDVTRNPSQWTPDRLISNMIFETVDKHDVDGCDLTTLRDSVMGKFWKRPMESYVSRLTDDWEQSQPPHLRHLALIRDTAVTDEKRFIHYVYRTRNNFQKGVESQRLSWKAIGVTEVEESIKTKLDQWGFPLLDFTDFHLGTGASSLAKCRASIDRKPRRVMLDEDAEVVKVKSRRGRPRGKTRTPLISKPAGSETQASDLIMDESIPAAPPSRPSLKVSSKDKGKLKQLDVPLLSAKQRLVLGLPPRGRLGIHIEEQIKAHRDRTGDASSLPDVIHQDDKATARLRQETRTKNNRSKVNRDVDAVKIFTREFKIAHGLPTKGRLAQNIVDHYRGHNHDTTSCSECLKGHTFVISERSTSLLRSEAGSDEEYIAEASTSTRSKRKAVSSGEQYNPSKRPRVDYSPRSGPALDESTEDVDSRRAMRSPDTAPTTIMPTTSSSSNRVGPDTMSTMGPIDAVIEHATIDKGYYSLGAETSSSLSSEPGFYLLPEGIRQVGQGRPITTRIAIFKSSRLSTLKWFSSSARTLGISDSVPSHAGLKQRDGSALASVLPHGQFNITQDADVPGANLDCSRNGSLEIASIPGANRDSLEASASRKIPLLKVQEQGGITSSPQNHSATGQHVKNWHAMKKARLTASLNPYISPYDSSTIALPPVQQVQKDLNVNEVSASPSVGIHAKTGASETATSETIIDEPSLHDITTQNVINSEASYQASPAAAPKVSRKKTGVLRGAGSVAFFRTLVIKELLERCHGVIPNNGEMLGPFFALWKQRAPHLREPSVDSPQKCINEMVTIPENNLYKITYAMPTMAGSTDKVKHLVAWKEIGREDRRITELQANVIKAWPKKFIPEGVRDLLPQEEISSPKAQVEEIDTSMEFNEKDTAATSRFEKRMQVTKRLQKDAAMRRTRNFEVEKAFRKKDQEISVSLQGNTGHSRARKKRSRLDTLNVDFPSNKVQNTSIRPHAPRAVIDEIDSDSSEDLTFTRLRTTPWRVPSPTNSNSSEDIASGAPDPAVRATPVTSTSSEEVYLSNFGPVSPEHLDGDLNITSEVPNSLDDPEQDLSNLPGLQIHPLTHDGFIDSNISASYLSLKIGPKLSMLEPQIRFHATTGTFSTEFGTQAIDVSVDADGTNTVANVNHFQFIPEDPSPWRKRVRFATDDDIVSSKKPRLAQQKEKVHSTRSKKSSPRSLAPTLLDRLTGLTGDPHDPIRIGPTRTKKKNYKVKGWRITDPKRPRPEPRSRATSETLAAADNFKKLLCTFVVASSFSADEGIVDWDIVMQVYATQLSFDLEKMKKVWAWIKRNMTQQLTHLTADFQNRFLEAYEHNAIGSINNMTSYDWPALVRWTVKTCDYPECPLPLDEDDLDQYAVEQSQYKSFDLTAWNNDRISHINRARRILKYVYAAPLDQDVESHPISDADRVRSWIRSNTATPQTIYNASIAHDKFAKLENRALEKGIAELTANGMIRMRKIKRLLPGRNFDFTARFALNYRKPFELPVFMDAVKFKKDLDNAFAQTDPTKRIYHLSRTAKDGAVMALIFLLQDGRISLNPRLPRINNENGAPHPRISVWGFAEGEYFNRKIDRQHFFWPIDAEPTPKYQFGNPLQPSRAPTDAEINIKWKELSDPPLPGRNDPDAMLPIWSSIHGDKVIWPWWNRILNLVLQSLMFQPGISSQELHRQLPAATTEYFEVKLVLDWLVATNAARNVGPDSYEALQGCWAAFGDDLKETGDDWFGDYVTRHRAVDSQKLLKSMQNFASSARVRTIVKSGEAVYEDDDEQETEDDEQGVYLESGGHALSMSQDNLTQNEDVSHADYQNPVSRFGGADAASIRPDQKTQYDVDMLDPDAEGEPELDAEGEMINVT